MLLQVRGIVSVKPIASAPPPVNSVAPVVSGAVPAGSLLTTTNGTWAPAPTSYAYQWRRGAIDIGGATLATYTTGAGDAGAMISCRVTAFTGGSGASATSNSIGPVTADDLLSGYTLGMRIDLTKAQAEELQVKDTVTPANVYLGQLYGFSGVSSGSPKLCMREDGSFRWSAHNECLQSEDFSVATWTKTGCTQTAGQVGPDGVATDATLLTATAATAYFSQSISTPVLANWYRTSGVVVKSGGANPAPWGYLEVHDSATVRRAWFNLATGALGTVDAGLTGIAGIATTAAGVAYAAGWYYVSAWLKSTTATTVLRIGPCDANGSVAVTATRTMLVTGAQAHRGVKRLAYLKTTTVVVRGVPYDWTPGERHIRVDQSTIYRGRSSDDLTAAAWTTNDCTVALDATGPHGEPCSTVTATGAGGTVTQIVASTGVLQCFSAFVRRKTGTGTLHISNDNGTTLKDVTADVGPAGGTYRQVFQRSSVANPTIQFRLGTSGDAFEIALANVSFTHHAASPVPSALADYTAAVDVLNIPTTSFPTDTAMTHYADLWLSPTTIGSSNATPRFGWFTGAAAAGAMVDMYASYSAGTPICRLQMNTNDGAALVKNIGNHINGGRLQIQQRLDPNNHAICYNGNASYWNHLVGSVAVNGIGILIVQSLWLRRLLVIPEGISDDEDELRTFKLDQSATNLNNNLLASAHVCKFGSIADTKQMRIPSLEVLSQTGDVIEFITVFGQRHEPGYNTEHPARMMQRRYAFDRSTNSITPLEAVRVIKQDANWVLGGPPEYQGYTLLKLKVGPYAGRLLLVHMQQNGAYSLGPPPVLLDDQRELYLMYSDDDGDTWSASTLILSCAATGAANFVATGENSTSFQLTYGTHTGRIYVSLNINNSNHYAWWCDDYKAGGDGTGTNWTYSTTGVHNSGNPGVAGTLSEPAITYWPTTPDPTIVMLYRNTGGGRVGFSTSTDYGVTLSPPIEAAGDNVSVNVNCGLVQAEPGATGTLGRVVIGRATQDYRIAHKVQSATDAALTWGNNYQLFPPERYTGYNAIKKAFDDDDLFVCLSEFSQAATGNQYEMMMATVFRYS